MSGHFMTRSVISIKRQQHILMTLKESKKNAIMAHN